MKTRFLKLFSLILPAIVFQNFVHSEQFECEHCKPQKSSKKYSQKKKSAHKKAPLAKKKTKPSKEKKYQDFIKKLVKHESLFNCYVKKNQKVYLEINESQLDKVWYLQGAMKAGNAVSNYSFPFLQWGLPLGSLLIDAFKWHKEDNSIWLKKPRSYYRWSKDDRLAKAAEGSYQEPVIKSFKIIQSHPKKKLYLVDATAMFNGGIFDLSSVVSDQFGGGFGYQADKFRVRKVKHYPADKYHSAVSVIDTFVHYGSSSIPRFYKVRSRKALLRMQLEDPRSVPLTLSFSMWFPRKKKGILDEKDSLPLPNDYVPRFSDHRLGFFYVEYHDIDRFNDEDNKTKLAVRWNLKKKDRDAKLSEPVRPITWTLDHTVPKRFRETVKHGILLWNKAFEEIGFKNAIVVQDPPKDKNWDPLDPRYNVVLWAVAPDTASAVGMPRIDPMTGEVLNARIMIDQSWVRSLELQHSFMLKPLFPEDPIPSQLLTEKGSFNKYLENLGIIPHYNSRIKTKQGNSWQMHCCQHAQRTLESATFAWNTHQANKVYNPSSAISKDEFVKQVIADVVCHEIGHTLGMMHNFVAASLLSTKQLQDDDYIDRFGLSASVMDYVPVNLYAAKKNGRNFAPKKVGLYDRWAIRWAYSDFGGKTPQTEDAKVKEIAKESGKREHYFLTDIDVATDNPYAMPYLFASDPINHASFLMKTNRDMRSFYYATFPGIGKDYARRTNRLIWSLSRTFRESLRIFKFLGGIYTHRNHQGDIDERPTLKPIAPALQRKAIDLITKECLAKNVIQIPSHVMNNLSVRYGEDSLGYPSWNAPIRQLISFHQLGVLYSLLSVDITNNILENGFKMQNAQDKYSIKEHFDRIYNSVFEELGKPVVINSTRRDLQRNMMKILLIQAGLGIGPARHRSFALGSVSGDVQIVAESLVYKLQADLGKSLARNSKDEMTQLHLKSMKAKVDRYLKRMPVDAAY